MTGGKVLLRSLALRFAISTFITLSFTAIVMHLLGYSIAWGFLTALAVLTAGMAAFGAGFDLRTRGVLDSLVRFLPTAMVGALSIAVADLYAGARGGYSDKALSLALALEIYLPLFTLFFLCARLCAIRAAKRDFIRGTARFDPEDVARRSAVKERFRSRKPDEH